MILQVLILLGVANGAPIVARELLGALDVAIVVPLFFLLHIAVSPVLYRLRIRKIP